MPVCGKTETEYSSGPLDSRNAPACDPRVTLNEELKRINWADRRASQATTRVCMQQICLLPTCECWHTTFADLDGARATFTGGRNPC